MATAGEITTLKALAASKGFNIYLCETANGSASGIGNFLVWSPQGKAFKFGRSLTEINNHLNSF